MGKHQTADDSHTHGLSGFPARTVAKGDGQGAEHGSQGCHHDRPEPQQACATNRIMRIHSVTLRVDREGEFIDRWPKGFFEERAEELF